MPPLCCFLLPLQLTEETLQLQCSLLLLTLHQTLQWSLQPLEPLKLQQEALKGAADVAAVAEDLSAAAAVALTAAARAPAPQQPPLRKAAWPWPRPARLCWPSWPRLLRQRRSAAADQLLVWRFCERELLVLAVSK